MACVKMAATIMASRSLTVWAVIAAIALAVQLGGYPLLDADEGRNAEIGREMAATNDYVMPRLDGMPYLDKPIVYFAAEAAMMEVAGATEFAARFPAWLFTIATASLIAWFASRAGINAPAAAVMFLSMPLTIAFARTVIFDSALSFFITLAIVAFYLEPPTLAWAAMAFGVITKGPVALAVPLIVAIPYAVWRKRARHLISIAGIVLFVAIIAPWVWAISVKVPDFLQYVLVTETAQRLTTDALRRTGPPWYFVPYLLGGALPWIFSLRRAAGSEQERWLDRFLILWIVVPFVFFSLSQSKRPQYILPLMPAIALVAARRWEKQRVAAIVLAVFGALILAASPFAHLPFGAGTAIILGAAAVACGAIAIFTRGAVAVIALSIPMLLIPITTGGVMRSIAGRRSEKALAADLRPLLQPNSEIIGIEAFTGSMEFYLQRPIIIVTPDAAELTSNYITRHYRAFIADPRSTIRPRAWLPHAFDGSRPRVVIVRANDARDRAVIEQYGARLVTEDAHFAAYTMPH
jgi:4-amino-4-deoxy-L-arabinose transferase-like glycosyltransferase